MKHQEHIISVITDNIKASPCVIPFSELDIAVKDIVFMQRAVLEQTPAFRQFIPYVIVKQAGQYLAYQRKSSGGESRLHNLYSIGIGGHVDAVDAVYNDAGVFQLQETLNKGMYRELKEELGLSAKDFIGMETLGYLAHDVTDVDKVHLGIVLIAEVQDKLVLKSQEDALDLVGLLSKEALLELNLESWSKTVVGQLNK